MIYVIEDLIRHLYIFQAKSAYCQVRSRVKWLINSSSDVYVKISLKKHIANQFSFSK